jgi:L-rhamnose isomerase
VEGCKAVMDQLDRLFPSDSLHIPQSKGAKRQKLQTTLTSLASKSTISYWISSRTMSHSWWRRSLTTQFASSWKQIDRQLHPGSTFNQKLATA